MKVHYDASVKKYKDLIKKLKLAESVFGVYDVADEKIIHTELKIIRCTSEGKIKWVSEFHYDVIVEIKMLPDKIKVKEFDGSEYDISINTGRELAAQR